MARLASSQPLRDRHDLPALPPRLTRSRALLSPRKPTDRGTESLGFPLLHPGLCSPGIDHHVVTHHLLHGHPQLPVPELPTTPGRKISCRGRSCLVRGDVGGVVVVVL